jgi:hypothetical protein
MRLDDLVGNTRRGSVWLGIGIAAACATALFGCGDEQESKQAPPARSAYHSRPAASSASDAKSDFGVVTYQQLLDKAPKAEPVDSDSIIFFTYDARTGRGAVISDFSPHGLKTVGLDTSTVSDDLVCVGLEGWVLGTTTPAHISYFPKYDNNIALFSSTVGNETYFYMWFQEDQQAFLNGSNAPVILMGILRDGQCVTSGPLSKEGYDELRGALKQSLFQYPVMQDMYLRLKAGERP